LFNKSVLNVFDKFHLNANCLGKTGGLAWRCRLSPFTQPVGDVSYGRFRDLKIDLNGDLKFDLKLSSAPVPI
jgi:hypothetical protein